VNGWVVQLGGNWKEYSLKDNLKHSHIVDLKNKQYIIDDNIYDISDLSHIFNGLSLFLFARNCKDTTIDRLSAIKLYRARIWDNNVLVRDFIPCYRKTDNEVGLYDLANGVFYTNSGTGEFVKGANVEMSLELRGKNLLDTSTVKSATTQGIKNAIGNSVVTLNGKANAVSNYSLNPIWRDVKFEAGKTYSGRLKMLSGTVVYGGVSIYVYQGGSYLATLGQIDNATIGKVSVLKYTFTQEQIDKGITVRVGVRSMVSSTPREAEFENATFQMEIVEGNYTSTTFPDFEPYFTPTTIQIPQTVTVDGTTVPLRFSIYDKIIVDRLNGKVTYSSGTWYKEFTGNEDFYQSTFAENNGFGRYFISVNDISVSGGYCTHFKRSGWLASKTVKNVFSWVEVTSSLCRISFKTDGNKDDTFANDKAEFKALLKSFYDAGTPVTVLAKLNTPDETVLYDKAKNITTDLGQALMDFANSTQNATNIITITSTPSVSKLSVNYAKWGGGLDDEI
jgi:hypothetical protein